MKPDYSSARSFPRRRESSKTNTSRSGQSLYIAPLRGNDAIFGLMGNPKEKIMKTDSK
jgi:hypothetical protein